MKFTKNWFNRLIEKEDDLKYVVIPFLLFALDLILRITYSMNIIDVGADMAFLSLSIIITLIIDSAVNRQKYIIFYLVAFLFILIFWIICLAIVSTHRSGTDFNNLLYVFISCSLGTISFFFSAFFAHNTV